MGHCLSGGANYSDQVVVELDFLYPSEGIHRRWDSGYCITAMAATSDQAAFVLNVPKKKPQDETQEMLRTSAFPSTHVKEKWAKNLYIAYICHGRTVSESWKPLSPLQILLRWQFQIICSYQGDLHPPSIKF
ncbi:hypothetical protein M0R45_031878 [Rubus argutus]|uniref:DUF7477 domain-containing protein n=1 Tax=Rubus argutus TaxID=59490 RepID=A0AAW1WJH2_RUBAR